MSDTTKIQERIDAAADAEAWAIIHTAFEGAKAVCKALKLRYKNAPDWDYHHIPMEVYSNKSAGNVEIVVDERLIREIERAIFEAVREHARHTHTDEFLAKMSSVLP